MWDTNSSFAHSLMYLLRCIIRKTKYNSGICKHIVLMVCFFAQILSQKSQNSSKELLPIFYKSILISYFFAFYFRLFSLDKEK